MVFMSNDILTWDNLPWITMHEKLFLMQKKIYKASQVCDKCYLLKLRHNLINCEEIKKIAIQTICNNIIKSNKDKYFINDNEKNLLFHSLYKEIDIKSNNILLINEKIYQYIFYLCIKPEWEARFEPIMKSNINHLDIHDFHNKLINFFKDKQILKQNYCYSFKDKIKIKYLDLDYLIYKISYSLYTNTKIKFWLNNQYFTENFIYELNEKNLYLDDSSNNLYAILKKIFYTGIEWISLCNHLYNYKFYHYSSCRFYRYFKYNNNWIKIITNNHKYFINSFSLLSEALGLPLNKLKFFSINKKKLFLFNFTIRNQEFINILKNCNFKSIIEISPKSFHTLVYKIKKILYHKNLDGKWRPNIGISLQKSLLKIRSKFLKWYNYYYYIISKESIKKYYQIIDSILFRWIKKYSKNSDINLLRINKKIIENIINNSLNIQFIV